MKYLDEYEKRIEDGTDVVGEWILLLIAYIKDGLENKEFFYDEKKAWGCIHFIERFCHHYEGRTDAIKLEPWQKFFLACTFGIVGDDGLRQFREVILVIARKQGKSLLAAAIQVYIMFIENEPGMQIYNIAPKLKQAEIIFTGAYRMVERVPALSSKVRKRRTDVYYPKKGASMSPLAFNGKKSDGFNPFYVTFDEFAAWDGEAGLKMADVMTSAVGARTQPLFLYTSTANYIDNGLWDRIMLRATSVLKGTSNEKRLLPFLYVIDDVEKWNDINELRKAMPNMGVSVTEKFVRDEIVKAEESLTYKSEFLTKYCNIKQNSIAAWLSRTEILKTTGGTYKLEDFRKCYGVGGVDLSRSGDLTSACVVIKKDGKDYIFSHAWMPAKRIAEAEKDEKIPYSLFLKKGFLSISGEHDINYTDVTNWFRDISKTYKIFILMVGYDRYSAQYYVDEMEKFGFSMDDVVQGTNLTPVINEFAGLVRDGVVNTGTNGLLQTHMASAALKHIDTDGHDNRVKIAKVDQRQHIDCLAAVLDAYCVRQKWWKKYAYRLNND